MGYLHRQARSKETLLVDVDYRGKFLVAGDTVTTIVVLFFADGIVEGIWLPGLIPTKLSRRRISSLLRFYQKTNKQWLLM